MADVLLISKAVAPPWNDSSKNLVRDLSTAMERHHPWVMGRRVAQPWRPPRGRVERVYPAGPGRFATGSMDALRVLGRLLAGPRGDLWHFFFAPNPRTSMAGRAAVRARRVPAVQTVCSAPLEGQDVERLLFADVTVVLSRHTESRLREAGVPPDRLRRIPPAQVTLEVPDATQRRAAREGFGLPRDAALIVYPGDLEFGGGAPLSLEILAHPRLRHAQLAMACRTKTPEARQAEAALRERARALGVEARVSWVGETSAIHALLGAADVVVLPSRDLYAKMDYPLVLLEAMSMERAVVTARGSAAEELGEGGAAWVCEADGGALADQVASLLEDDARRAELGATARRVVGERYAPASVAAAYERVYDDLLGAP
jgi:glycosyltransferase involved in cell wall biosynthesis